ncbi:MAG TPA: RNA polymerase sigma factor [Acidobacteriaceae bacterium]|nr:RNA polymerase sigma factor [Acidobacteriaceae bacterium]
MPEDTDEHLLYQARLGNESCFMVLFERYRDIVFRLAYRLTDEHAAEDITQDCFLGLLGHANHFDPAKGSLRTYLYGAVRNLARKHYWLHQGDVELDDESEDPSFVAEPIAARLLLQHETSELIHQAVVALPLAQREALVLFQYEELSLSEIATILAIDVGTVKSRLHRARSHLRKTLSPYFERSIIHEPT